jgi:hypothetical protein
MKYRQGTTTHACMHMSCWHGQNQLNSVSQCRCLALSDSCLWCKVRRELVALLGCEHVCCHWLTVLHILSILHELEACGELVGERTVLGLLCMYVWMYVCVCVCTCMYKFISLTLHKYTHIDVLLDGCTNLGGPLLLLQTSPSWTCSPDSLYIYIYTHTCPHYAYIHTHRCTRVYRYEYIHTHRCTRRVYAPQRPSPAAPRSHGCTSCFPPHSSGMRQHKGPRQPGNHSESACVCVCVCMCMYACCVI